MNDGSFKEKIIRTTITLAPKSGSFSRDGANTLTIQGLETSCQITYGNGEFAPTAYLRIWGMDQDDMNKLTSIKWNVEGVQNNLVKIEAGDDIDDLDVVYQGNISFAYPDYFNAPNVFLCIESNMALYHQLNPVAPSSYKGEADVATIMKSLAELMGMGFENNGVNVKLNNPYLPNTAFEQWKAIADMAGIDYHTEFGRFIICRKGFPRNSITAIVSPSSGMLGYPVPNNIGASFSHIYDRNIKSGCTVIIRDSIITQCNGTWLVTGIDINLECGIENGAWEMAVNVAQIGEPGDAPKVTN